MLKSVKLHLKYLKSRNKGQKNLFSYTNFEIWKFGRVFKLHKTFEKLESSQLSGKCCNRSVPDLTSVLTVSQLRGMCTKILLCNFLRNLSEISFLISFEE